MPEFDFIIAGGGAAGLGLAYQMINSPLKGSSILIVDKAAKDQNDRTWCFWSEHPTIFDPIIYRSWERVGFYSPGFERVLSLAPFRYNLIRGIDFYQFTRQALEQTAGVTFLQARVEGITDGPERALVRAGGQEFSGRWVFDSILRPGDLIGDPTRYHNLKQHFLGWEIETSRDVFDPETPVLFDFRTPQQHEMRFFYLLPFSSREALVEYTLFSAHLLKREEYESALRAYLGQILKPGEYTIRAVERGIIPMTDHPFPRRLGQRVMAVGTKGGRVKPSSGYAFLRMAQDGERIVSALAAGREPFSIPTEPARYRFYDRIMLQLMYRQGEKMAAIFTALFRNNPPARIFHFLDENQSLWQDVRLMASLPVGTFLRAMLKVQGNRL